MASSPTGWLARFQTAEERETKQPGRLVPVTRWDENGLALIVDEAAGRLVPAREFDNFVALVPGDRPVVAALPGAGWRAVYAQDDGQPDYVEDLVGWAVHDNGYATPIAADPELMIGEPLTTRSPVNAVRLLPPEPGSHAHPVNPGPPVN
ncbi:hypothetical protein GCM10010441_39650 [Kitasatospora paracochleata]|uniref:Uncharacterized protein n=1 Tax=Kitasatospora paracochleata TaxID=58354 RepID=A0ABT1IW06_9ACTN|nr:hypothetical protein [Kitasatospora paracochleata]MCP2309315.1 hypothetical protein [Kitasatospora paracochleata]